MKMKAVMRGLLAALMIFAGVMHFVDPAPFVKIVPSYLPSALLLVYVSGVFEIVGGVGLLIPSLRQMSGWGLIALYVAVFPANVYMAMNNISLGEAPMPAWALWLRLPLQLVLILWAWWVSRKG